MTHTHTHTVGILGTKVRPIAENLQHTTLTSDRYPTPLPAEFESANPASERPQTLRLRSGGHRFEPSKLKYSLNYI